MIEKNLDLMLTLGSIEPIDQFAITNSVHWYSQR